MSTTFNLNTWLVDNRCSDSGIHSERVVCADGFSISVQANEYTYSAPRDNIGPWSQVECGFPSSTPELIMSYCESPEAPTHTVYSYVPIKLVEELIALHGGVVKVEAVL